MSDVSERNWSLPTREELSAASRWVWVLLAVAVALFALGIVSATTITFDRVVGAVLSTGPLLVAAALMWVAPRERLLALSALGFAIAPTLLLVRLAFLGDVFLLPGMPNQQYVAIADRLRDLSDAVGGWVWLITLAAVLCLAVSVGVIRSRGGWTIVAVGVVLAAVVAVRNLGSLPPADEFPEMWSVWQLARSTLAPLTVAAWAYLAAVAFDRRLFLLTFAAALRLAVSLVGLISFGVFASSSPDMTVDSLNTANMIVASVDWLLFVAFWPLLIAAILLELPRRAHVGATSIPAPQEAYSAGR